MGRPSSEAQVRRYFVKVGIQRQGPRMRPAQYPEDSVNRIKGYFLGADLPPMNTAAAALKKLPSMAQLRKARTAAKGKARR